jgi:hypothetical protein
MIARHGIETELYIPGCDSRAPSGQKVKGSAHCRMPCLRHSRAAAVPSAITLRPKSSCRSIIQARAVCPTGREPTSLPRPEDRAVGRARWALQLQRLDLPTDEPFAALIMCTADRDKIDKRTRSKWSRALRYAAEYKSSSEPLATFIQRKGRINQCAARFTRSLGQGGRN